MNSKPTKIIGIVIILLIIMGGISLLRYFNTRSYPTELVPAPTSASGLSVAVFAGGCFWCTESDFEKVPGVSKVISGYTGGTKENPTYEEVSHGGTGHIESVQVFYDNSVVTYNDLLNHFWQHIDPTDSKGQFVDKGESYVSAIFYNNDSEKAAAEASRDRLRGALIFTEPIVTLIRPAGPFYEAEEYHQDFYKKNPIRYEYYRSRSGRDEFLGKYWTEETINRFLNRNNFMKPSKEELKKKLTAIQYKVTQEDGTEPPFKNEYNDEHREGIFVDIVSGEPLYSSKDKYESGTGWPSFVKPLSPTAVVLKEDNTFFSTRTEVRSAVADSHLGHVFDDGPVDRGGKRYCMNSAAMRFIPKEDLVKEGYAEYSKLFN